MSLFRLDWEFDQLDSAAVAFVQRQEGARVAEMQPNRAKVVFSEDSNLNMVVWVRQTVDELLNSTRGFVQHEEIV